jgi:hypothetical protein
MHEFSGLHRADDWPAILAQTRKVAELTAALEAKHVEQDLYPGGVRRAGTVRSGRTNTSVVSALEGRSDERASQGRTRAEDWRGPGEIAQRFRGVQMRSSSQRSREEQVNQ